MPPIPTLVKVAIDVVGNGAIPTTYAPVNVGTVDNDRTVSSSSELDDGRIGDKCLYSSCSLGLENMEGRKVI